MSRDTEHTSEDPSLRDNGIGLPLLSFIVTNHNYGRFLERCVTSIFSQSYTKIECIIVDDASTDESPDILKRIQGVYPEVKVILNTENLGQTRSCIRGYEQSSGHYIALIDADDQLLTDYAATHIHAHMRLRSHVGFSSCDMLECINEELVVASCFDTYLLSTCTRQVSPAEVGKVPAAVEVLLPPVQKFKMRRVNEDNTFWTWAPTSGSVYRRDAIKLFFNNTRTGKLKYSTDAYLNFAINALCGSVLIERACAIYHIHGGNGFVKSASLERLKTFEPESDYGCFAAYCALEHIILNFEIFAKLCFTLPALLTVLKTLATKSRQSRFTLALGEKLAVALAKFVWRRRMSFIVPFRR